MLRGTADTGGEVSEDELVNVQLQAITEGVSITDSSVTGQKDKQIHPNSLARMGDKWNRVEDGSGDVNKSLECSSP